MSVNKNCDYAIDNGFQCDCTSLFNCCDCGGANCGCHGCFSCNACDSCLNA